MPKHLVKLFSTFFYTGYAPLAPGTVGSAAAALVALIFIQNIFIYVALFAIFTVIGFWVSGQMEEIEGQKDPSCVVIDEVSGIFVSFFLLPVTWPVVITTFFVFRAFDMFKIYPADKLEGQHGSYGIMIDDIIAGVYTNIVMQIAVRLAGIV